MELLKTLNWNLITPYPDYRKFLLTDEEEENIELPEYQPNDDLVDLSNNAIVTGDSLKVVINQVAYKFNEYTPTINLPTKVSELENDGVYTTQKELYGAQDSADVAEAVLYNKETEEFVFVNPDDLSNYSVETYEPVGVVAIPSSHDVYGDGKCGVISLVNMSYSTPDTGSTSIEGICWGCNTVDTSLTNFTQVPQFGTASKQTDSLSATPVDAYLPSDNFSAQVSIVDPEAYYYYTSNNSTPSPYLADGSRNPFYHMTDGVELNALSDFDGIGNTQALLDLATGEDWKTLDTITNSYSASYYPAAECTWRFHTSGTNQGDWYLPACGELGYAVVRLKAINATITALNTVYGTVGSTVASVNCWSSSEYSSGNARRIYFGSGYVSYNLTNNNYYVRAFLRLTPTSTPGTLDNYVKKSEISSYTNNLTYLDPTEVESYLNNIL